ncbi:pyridoxal phosphate-dependent aminotransferase [Edaphobacter flagellatus]|uniref:pyridoxal phosphate-dependent aminotransferase n=1 Tax=Edaphobacter flagellatus TaxID=1933044 RepID=UPI0021B3187F|nr:pyridoxal phosphate-dependent aminotransferase [Edaphobacter flagellatus]
MVGAEVVKGRGLGLSALAPRVVQSEIRAMTMESDRVGGVNLAQGVCDTEVPSVVAEAAKAAIDEGHNIYTRLDGIPRLRRAIAEKTERMQGLVVDPEREVLVTSGATGAFHAVALALFDPGDEVLLFEPFYGYHVGTLRSMRVVPVAVELEMGSWALDLDRVRAAITPKTRAIVVNTPSNPAGKVFTRAELEGLAEIAREHDLFILTDEIYEHFVYGEAKHISPAAIEGMRERTIIMSGYSKTFSVTGWRIGYVIADAKWLGAIGYFSDLLYVCAPAPFQHGVAAGIERLGRTFYAGLALEHESKREMLVGALRDAGLDPYVPDGAYYILASTAGLGDVLEGENAAQRARSLLKKTGVAAVAGSAFFRTGKGEDLLRFCFAKKDEDLEEACRRLRSLK